MCLPHSSQTPPSPMLCHLHACGKQSEPRSSCLRLSPAPPLMFHPGLTLIAPKPSFPTCFSSFSIMCYSYARDLDTLTQGLKPIPQKTHQTPVPPHTKLRPQNPKKSLPCGQPHWTHHMKFHESHAQFRGLVSHAEIKSKPHREEYRSPASHRVAASHVG